MYCFQNLNGLKSHLHNNLNSTYVFHEKFANCNQSRDMHRRASVSFRTNWQIFMKLGLNIMLLTTPAINNTNMETEKECEVRVTLTR
jgi:hypothetical protein